MKPSLRINLQQQNRSRFATALVLLTALLVVYQVGKAISLRNEIATLQQQAQGISNGGDTRTTDNTAAFNDADQTAVLQRIRADLLMPWETVLDAIADNAGAAVALRAVRPDPATRQAEVSGVAHTRHDFLDYVERLQKDRRLQHAEPLADEPNRMPTIMNNEGVLFRLRVTWEVAP